MMQVLLDSKKSNLSPAIRYAFALMLFDAVTVDQIEIALAQKPFRIPDGISISWQTKNGLTERKMLSPMTVQLFSQVAPEAIKSINQKQLISLYNVYLPGRSLRNDQLEWLSFHTPGPIFEHLKGNVLMAAVPDSAYVRLMTQKALSNHDQQQDDAMTLPLIHFFESKTADRSIAFIEQINHACRRRVGIANAVAKKAMLQDCLHIANLLYEYGPLSSLILSWAISLITEGTRTLENLSQAAISNYVTSASKGLFNEFKGQDLEDLDEAGFVKLYIRVIESVSDGQKNIVASAISSFHAFMEDWIGVVPINRNQYHKDIEPIPKANVIWQHEIVSALQWLKGANCDERLVQLWTLALLIGSQQRIRISELFRLRLSNVQFFDKTVQVEIEQGKTKAAKRYLHFDDPAAIEALRLMLERRKRELARPGDFIFGDPKAPGQIYKRGQFYFGLNKILKKVTGDRTVSFHTLSHAVISFKLIEPLVGGEHGFRNPLSQLATDFGHFSVITSLNSYMHLYPVSLRLCMSRALKTVKINSFISAAWSGKTSDAIRKQISVKKLNSNEFYWNCIFDCNKNIPYIEDIKTAHPLVIPIPPDMLQKISEFKFENLLYVLKDLSDGISLSAMELRNSIDRDYINLILKELARLLFMYRLAEIPMNASDTEVLVAIKNIKKSGFDFHRTKQSKYKKLLDYLSQLTWPVTRDIEESINAWIILAAYPEYQSLNEKTETLKLLEFLKHSGVDITHIAVFLVDDQFKKARTDTIKKLFLMTYSIPPAIFMVNPRRGRPKVYVGITKHRVESEIAPYSSAISVSGFKAIMLTLTLFKMLGDSIYV
jgi:integrase